MNEIGFELHQTSKTDGLTTTAYNDTVYLANIPDNSINTGDGNDTVYGGQYKDTITGGLGDDILHGGDGNDTIYGDINNTSSYNGGNDTLIGGLGNDFLDGGRGDDTYIYNLGDGLDTINDSHGNEIIKFGEWINQSDLAFNQDENNLIINIDNNPEQGVIIQNYFSSDSYRNKTIVFDDETTLDLRNADQLIQAMNSFSISNSASTDTLSNSTQDVSDMYSLAASQDLTRKAI